MKKFLVIIACMLLLCSMLVWGTPALADQDAAAILLDGAKAMDKLESFSFNGSLSVAVEDMIDAMTFEDALTGDFIRAPLRCHAKFNAMGSAFDAYAEEKEGKLLAYAKTDALWKTYRFAVPNKVLLNGVDAVAAAGILSASVDWRVEEVTEQIFGKDVRCISAVADLRRYLGQARIEALLSKTLVPLRQGWLPADAVLPIGVKVYVEVATGNVLRMQIDLSQTISAVLTAAVPQVVGQKSKQRDAQVLLTIDFSNFNQAADFEIPAEAKEQ